MHSLLPATCAALALALVPSASLLAQGAAPPGTITIKNPHPNLSSPAVPSTDVHQVHMIHLPSDPPNVFLAGLSGTGVQSTYGGVGGLDVLAGKYDVLTDTFTPNNDAAALNTTGTEFGLMYHHTGLYAVFDRLPGPPQLAKRASLTSPWQLVGPVNGVPSQSYYDPSLADYKGQTHLLYVLGTNIAMSPIDLNTGQLMGSPITIVLPARSGSTANSPTPIVDSNGELIGLSHHDVLGSDNDHYMSLDLDANTPAVLFNDTTTWTNNGGFIGGRFFDAESATPYHLLSIDAYWTTGGRAPVGGNMEIRVFIPPTTATDVSGSWILMSSGFLSTPLPLPPFAGAVGITNVLLALQTPPHNNMNGEALLTLPIPNDPTLSGLKVPMQSFTLTFTTNTAGIGNTAYITVD